MDFFDLSRRVPRITTQKRRWNCTEFLVESLIFGADAELDSRVRRFLLACAIKRTRFAGIRVIFDCVDYPFSNPPGSGGAGVEKPSVLGGRVCASRVSRGEARHPLVRVGDCERRCGAELILSGKVRVPSAVFPKHPREPSSPALPRRARRVPRARGGADLVITTRASRSARVSRERAFERAARPRPNARPLRVFLFPRLSGATASTETRGRNAKSAARGLARATRATTHTD